MSIELSEQEQLRRQSLAALRELGIDPYPAARYEVTATAREIAENFDPAKNNFQGIRIAGRIMSRRIMGSASWCMAYRTKLPNNNSGIDLVGAENGKLYLVCNPVKKNWGSRSPLDLLVSEDGARAG